MSVTQPTHDWDFRQTVSAGGTVKDNISGTFATYNNGLTSDATNGLDLTGTSANKFASLEAFNTGTEFSMEFYFQKTADTAGHWPYLIDITSNPSSVTSGDNFFAISWDRNTEPHDLFCRLSSTAGTADTILIDDANVYAHFVVTFNDTTKELKQYLNGSLVLTDTINTSLTDTTYTHYYLGATPLTTTRQFNSYLYYFRYWKNGVLSSSDVSTLYANRSAINYFGTQSLPIPTHDWDFRQTVSAGGTIGDNISGTTATLTGVAADATNGAAFTDSNHTDYIALTPFNTGTEFSMEFYFQKLTFTSSNWPVLIHMSDSQTGFSPNFCYFQHDKTNNDLQTSFNSNSSNGIDDSTNLVIADNDYVHFVVTWNDTSKELNHYLNGSLVETVTLSSLSFTDATYTYNYLGNNTSVASKGYNTNFYYFRYWKNGILSSSDVSTLYANRSAINYFSTPYESGIVPSFDYDFRTGNKDIINGTAEAKYYQYSSGTSTEITKTHTIDGVSIVGDTPTAAVSGSSSGRDNAGGQYIDLTGDLDTSYDQITIEVYVNIDSTTGKEVDNAGIFHFGNADRVEMFKLYTNYGTTDYINMIAQYNENTSSSITTNTSTDLFQNLCDGNTYMHLVYTCNGPTVTVYLNGASFLTNTNSSFSFGSSTRSLCELGRSSMYSTLGGFPFATYKYCRVYNTALSSTQATTLYNNRDSIKHFQLISDLTTLRINYGDVYLAQNLMKTLDDYKADNIPLYDISFGAFPSANKYKQSYLKTIVDISGDFVHRKHTFIGDISFNNDLSINNFMVVNNDVSLNTGFIVNGDASFNGNVNVIDDISLNGTLNLKDNTIEKSKLNFNVITNEGTFDTNQDVSLNSTLTIQGDFDKYIDTAGNIQTDFSENVVLIPSSLGLDLSGGSATLSGKTGDQAFLNGTYIVKDNSGNTTGNIYDDLNENTTETPAGLSATPDYYWDFRVPTPAGNTLADRVSGINATYVGGIISNDVSGLYFHERPTDNTVAITEYATVGDMNSGTDFSIELYYKPESSNFASYGQIFQMNTASAGTSATTGFHLIMNFVERSGGHHQPNASKFKDGDTSTGQFMRFADAGYTITSDDGLDNNQGWSNSGSLSEEHYILSYNNSTKNWKYFRYGSTVMDVTCSTFNNGSNQVCSNNWIGTDTSPSSISSHSNAFGGAFYFIRYYKDKVLTEADSAILYANRKTINWDFQTYVNNNKLTSLPKNWNSLQVNSRGNWVYDGSSNYTSYLDQYGRPQTVKGDNYDLTLPFHFYPSKAFLRTTPILPASSSINPHNYPASVKFLGSSNTSVTLPTHSWDFRQTVSSGGTINDTISGTTATYNNVSSDATNGLDLTTSGNKFVNLNPFNTGTEFSMEFYFQKTAYTTDTYSFLADFTSNTSSFGTDDNNFVCFFWDKDNEPHDLGARVNGNIGTLNTLLIDDSNVYAHFVFTFNATTNEAKYYLNGSLVITDTVPNTTYTDTTYTHNYIGSTPFSTSSQFHSYLYYFRYWKNGVLTADEIQTLYSNRSRVDYFSTISKYHLLGEFSNKATNVIADSSANYTYNSVVHKTVAQDDANIGTIPTFSWDFRQNVSAGGTVTDIISGNVATLSGTNASCTTSGGLTLASDNTASGTGWADYEPFTPSSDGFSLEIYFKIGNISWWPILFVAGTSQTGGAGTFINAVFQHGGGSTFSNRHSINATSMASNTNMNENTDYHMVITLDAVNTVFTVYIDGSQIVQHTSGSGFNNGFPDVSSLSTTTYNRIGARGDDLRGINGNVYYARVWNGTAITSTHVSSLYAARTTSNIYSNTQNYIHGADFLYDLNRKYYINQLRMIVDQAPDSSGNSYGQYSIDRLAYSGSSFSGKKLENSYPNLYLNTAAHDISYGFTEDHTNIVYDLSYNKNQLPIIDMSGGGGIHIAPREISIQDSSLNTINIHKPTIKNTYNKPTYAENTYSIVAPATDASFNTEFYSHFGARDASGHFNKRISQDGKTIATLQNRGYEAYDVSNAEVIFSTDYGKNWKNILRDCSDSFLFTEHDISYGLLFATGDATGAIDIATSSNGQTMYLGRQRNIFSLENNYTALGHVPAIENAIPSVAATNNHTQTSVDDLRYFPQSFIGNNTGSSDLTISNLTGEKAAFNGTWKVSFSSGITTSDAKSGLWACLGTDTWSGQYVVNNYSAQYSGWQSNQPTTTYNGGSVTGHYLLLEFPSYVKFSAWYYWVDDALRTGSFVGTDSNGVNQLLGTWSDSWNNGQQINIRNVNGANNTYVNKLYIIPTNFTGNWCWIHPMWFTGTYETPEVPGISIPTTGLPEIYSTNYGNSWKLSPRKYHKGPTIISGDGSTILLLQESKLDNAKHAYSTISGYGNNNPYVDTHWITTDYGSNWNTLNRSGYDISNNVIPPSYGSKTATFLKACMSYTGQYIYIYNVQCTTNSNYGELYYSHDYGNTWNKWTTVEAQNYVASGNTLAGSGQILCSGNGKYVFIAGQTAGSSRLSQAIYYRSTDYGVTFNKDITTFPWQEGSSGEDSTSRGPFISYEGDLIVISNTHYKYIDDSDATQSYSSTTDAGLKYSLDYGVNYNVLDLSGESLYNATTNFSTLPNKTNKNLSDLFSTKGDIFSNCPGPNDYSFLTAVMGGNTTDASFVFLQSIEFPKDKVSTSVEKEGPVITTYEEPIDTENDFGNITTTSLPDALYYSSAISEDGQVLLTSGATVSSNTTDISYGAFYGGYNLTNAKFPPTENIVSVAIPTPAHYWDFRRSSVNDAKVDNIQQKSFYTWQGVNVSTTNGAVVDDQAPTDSLVINNLTLDTNFTIELFYKKNANSINSPGYNALFQLNSPSEVHFNMGNIWYRALQGAIWIHSNWGNDSGGYPYNGNYTQWLHEDDTEYHLVLVFDDDTSTFTEYRNNSVWHTYTSLRSGQQHTYEIFTLGGATGRQASSNGTTSGQEPTYVNRNSLNHEGDYYYLRFYNYALNAKQVDTLYQGRNTINYNNWTAYANIGLANIPHFKTAQLSYNGNYAMIVPYGITQTNTQNLYYWSPSGDFHRFDGNYLSNFDAENWKFGKLSGNGNFFVGFTHSSTTLSDASYNSATWWQDKVSNTMIIYKNLYTMPHGTVSDSDATTYGQGTTYDLNNAFSTDSGVTEYYITSVHVSETGQYVLFVGGNSATTLTNRCAFSKDYGVTFTNITSLFSFTDITKPLVYCHVSDNGRYLFISQYNSNEYCFSTDYGASFTLHNTFPSSTKTYGVVSKDGQNALFMDTNKHVYVSVNGNFRQEVIPSLSGTNTNLSLNHNYWKYKTTLTDEFNYNPSMPNIKYLIGTSLTKPSPTQPTYSWNLLVAASTGDIVYDSVSNNTATYEDNLTGSATLGTVNNSNGGRLRLPSSSISFHLNFSFEVVVRFNSQLNYNQVFFSHSNDGRWGTGLYYGNSTSHKLGFFLSTTTIASEFYSTNTGTYTGSTHLSTDGSTYYHIVCVCDGANDSAYIYQDGTKIWEQTSIGLSESDFPITPSTYVCLGKEQQATNINVKSFRIWETHALSATEITALYTNRDDTSYISTLVDTSSLSSSNVRYTESYFSELDIKGSLTNLSGTAYTSSDYRVKENVRDLEVSDSIASLSPISYTQNNLHHKKSIGFLAHEFANSFPDLVDGTKDGPEMQSINYNGIIAVLIKEIQTLRAKINKLKSEI